VVIVGKAADRWLSHRAATSPPSRRHLAAISLRILTKANAATLTSMSPWSPSSHVGSCGIEGGIGGVSGRGVLEARVAVSARVAAARVAVVAVVEAAG